MTAMEMDIMTMEMRNRGAEIPTRSDLDNYAYYLMCGLNAIGRRELAVQLENLYEEMRQMGLAADTVNLNINYFLFQLIYLATEQDDCVDQKEILHFIGESTFEEGVTRGSSVHMVHFALEYVEKEIRENYAENLTLRELSKKYYVNSAYLGQIFRKKFGQSFKEYLNNYRMEQAVQRLLYTSDKIYQIALDVGYKDCDYFINRFIAAKGCTPAKFRRQGGVLKN